MKNKNHKWASALLGQITTISSGTGFPNKFQGQTDEEYPFYKVSDMNLLGNERWMRSHNNSISRDVLKELKSNTHPIGTVIFPKIGAAIATNKKRVLSRESCFDNNVIGIHPSENIDTMFIYHLLLTKNLSDFSNSGNPPSIRKTTLEEWKIPLPPLPEQKRIAAILDAADALRNQRRQSITELDLLLQSTFLEMFGDPVENPKGWDVGCIGDLLESASYGTSKKANEGDGEYPILRMNNITYSGGWNFSSLKYIDFDEKEKKKYLVNKGDILFNRTNSKELVGKTAVYRRSEPMAFAGYLVKGIPSPNANSEYIGGFMNLPQTKLLLQNMCKSIIGMANINAKEFQAIAIPKPPIELQEKFAEIVEGIEGQKARLQAHLTELDTLFASLQQRAFNGEL